LVKAFGTAGVRGVFNRTQTPEQIYRLVETITFALGKGWYGVGWDGRKASALLARTVLSAVNVVGSDAHVFGLVPTPVLAFGTRSKSCIAGFSVTASHNPPEFSGIKVFNHNGMELPKSDEERIERAMAVEVMKPSGRFGQAVPDEEVLDDYVQAVVSRHQRASQPLRIAVDCASGPGGLVTPEILERLGHHVVPVNAQVSWRFPARPPEPTATNLSDFAKMVPTLGVDFAFAHDGDADRLVMVDSKGSVVPDSILTILALRGLGLGGGSAVISENSSSAVAEEAQRLGLSVKRSRVGKTFAVLEAEGGVFAAEPSKVVDPKWGLWEDSVNAARVGPGYSGTRDAGNSVALQADERQVDGEDGRPSHEGEGIVQEVQDSRREEPRWAETGAGRRVVGHVQSLGNGTSNASLLRVEGSPDARRFDAAWRAVCRSL
jgi:phosphomannomutase